MRKDAYTKIYVRDVALSFQMAECLVWPFSRDRDGYARMGQGKLASRYVCEAIHGAPPTPDHYALHSCDNGQGGCVNPNHLRWGTHAENMLDMVSSNHSVRGERQKASKLTAEYARAIIAAKNTKSQADIAADFGISQSTVSRVLSGKYWSWIGESA